MTLLELKKSVDRACEMAKDRNEKLDDIIVSLQIDDADDPFSESIVVYNDIELYYDGNCQVSGCVLQGYKD
jgi:hypothetical protein